MLRTLKIKLSAMQLRLTSAPGLSFQENTAQAPTQMSLISIKESATRAELIWALKNVNNNYSASSCEDISEVFNAMFPGLVPEQFSLGRTKLGYLITEALGPYFKNDLLKDVQNCGFYTILYDETTNKEAKKELQITIRYWSEKRQEVVESHLETFFLGFAKATDLVEHIEKAINGANLHLSKLLMLGSDGPNVNKKVARLINDQVKESRESGKPLIDIGSCNIHIVHNAFLKGLQSFGEEASDLILNIYYFFSGWPTRDQEFEEVQTKLKLPHHRFIKHVSSRWLTLQPAAERLLEQWPAILEYFLVILPKGRKSVIQSTKYVNIIKLLKMKNIKLQLHFVIDSAKMFTTFTAMFQKQEPLIHILYVELKRLVVSLAGRVCLPEKVLIFDADQLFKSENLLPVKNVEVCDEVSRDIGKLGSEKQQLEFLFNAQSHYIAACKHLLNKTPLGDDTLVKHCQSLQPHEIPHASSIRNISKIAQMLPLEISTTLLKDEWRLLQMEQVVIDPTAERVDHFWRKIFSMQIAGHPKYPLVTKVVKTALSLSHGNAEVERGFSLSKRVLTEDKASMNVRTLNSRLHVVDGLKKFNNRPALVPITRELIGMAQIAHRSYTLYLEEQKSKAKEDAVKRAAEEEKLRKEEMAIAALQESTKSISAMEKEAEVTKKNKDSQQKSYDSLLTEANARLKSAIDKNDLVGMRIAQGLMEGAISIHSQERKEDQKLESIKKKIDKRKSTIISMFAAQTNKKPKNK